MNKKYFQLTVFSLVAIAFGTSLLSNSSGPGGDRTGAPGSSGNCSSCHGGTANNGGDLVITAVDASSAKVVTSFEAGKKYTIGIKMGGTSLRKGFNATVLDVSNKFVGSVSNVSAGATSYASGTRTIVGHNAPGLGVWYFDWTAPTTGLTDVTVHASGVVSNSNNNDNGDQVIKTSLTLSAATSSNKSLTVNNLNIYPNPAQVSINLTQKLKSVVVFSASGNLVYKGSEVEKIDIQNWASGLYFVQGFMENNQPYKGQFIKQ